MVSCCVWDIDGCIYGLGIGCDIGRVGEKVIVFVLDLVKWCGIGLGVYFIFFEVVRGI